MSAAGSPAFNQQIAPAATVVVAWRLAPESKPRMTELEDGIRLIIA
jgi:hypothetical protein